MTPEITERADPDERPARASWVPHIYVILFVFTAMAALRRCLHDLRADRAVKRLSS